jgi:hypothetical protein
MKTWAEMRAARIWEATARLGAVFCEDNEDVACGTANICAALEAVCVGASPDVRRTCTHVLGGDTGWLKREGRYVGLFLKERDHGRPIKYSPHAIHQAENVGIHGELHVLKNAAQMNHVVKEKTKGHIAEIVTDELINDPDTLLVALAAEYILVEWKHQFPLADTHEEAFRTGNSTMPQTVRCPMMRLATDLLYMRLTTQTHPHYTYQLAVLPTHTPGVYGVVVLPPNDEAMQPVMMDFCHRQHELHQLIDRNAPMRVVLKMPRIKKLMQAKEISSTVQKFGLGDLYEPNSLAQMAVFENDDRAVPIAVSCVFHATFLKWNEKGAEAAAATAVVATRSLAVVSPETMTCNRPFAVYLIDIKVTPIVLFSMVVSDGSCFDFDAPGPASSSEAPRTAPLDPTDAYGHFRRKSSGDGPVGRFLNHVGNAHTITIDNISPCVVLLDPPSRPDERHILLLINDSNQVRMLYPSHHQPYPAEPDSRKQQIVGYNGNKQNPFWIVLSKKAEATEEVDRLVPLTVSATFAQHMQGVTQGYVQPVVDWMAFMREHSVKVGPILSVRIVDRATPVVTHAANRVRHASPH